MKYAIISNPKAGMLCTDKKKAVLEEAARILGDCKVYGLDTKTVEEFMTCADDVSKKSGTLIVAGGDGTLHDVINTISPDVVLSYIPLGSGNAIKYALGLPETVHETAEQIKNGNQKSLDIILCDGSRKTFLADIGLGGHIMNERQKHLHEGKKGRIAYALASINQTLNYERGNATVVADNEILLFNQAWSFVLTKICCTGYGLNVVPKAKLDDGFIHFLGVNSGWFELLYGMATSFFGKNRTGRYLACQRVEVLTSKEEYLEIGGDVYKKGTNFLFEILPGSLKMRY
ncbi:hypothetical protein FJZ53_06680 [Candidatus Woesearchaeota archaeon]|nr:hypothetical protein [Candidatus Woesearchaeota archaeon]